MGNCQCMSKARMIEIDAKNKQNHFNLHPSNRTLRHHQPNKIKKYGLKDKSNLHQIGQVIDINIQNQDNNIEDRLIDTNNKWNRKMRQKLNASDFVDPQCYHFKQITLDMNKMIAKSWVNIFGKIKLIGQCEFMITFHKIGEFSSIGICDKNYKTLKHIDSNNQNIMQYYKNGNFYIAGSRVYTNKNNQNGGFKIQQTITVKVNLQTGIIIFSVNGHLRYKTKLAILTYSKIDWVAFISLMQGDCVEIAL